MRHRLIILMTIICLGASGARQPAWGISKDSQFNLAVFSLGTLGFSTLAWFIWKNSPAQRAKGYPENLGPGEWYVGAYAGPAFLPSADWDFSTGFSALKGRTAQNVGYQPGVLGGLKFGRYFDDLPWFGWEWETNFCRHAVRRQTVSISPSLAGGQTSLALPPDRFYIWNVQFNLLARYGVLKDKEVTFGRLQPYAGLGPGFEMIYGESDSAKNFAIAAMAGLRYMYTPSIAIFCEYKFSYQFDVEIENKQIAPNEQGTVTFNVPHHRLVFGVAYHFKNLFGN